MINFNKPPFVPKALEYIQVACEENCKQCGDGLFTKQVSHWLMECVHSKCALMTTSCSHALDMMAFLADIKQGDEVILPSYNFVSAANAVVSRGAKCVFVDIRPDTMNIDENKIEDAITSNTKAIFPMHYAGVSCEMNTILEIAKRYNLIVLEDAAQGILSTYYGRALGSMGLFGSYSFHETKNFSMGEGGCLLINDSKYIERAEILREKGTDRSKFWRGEVDKYTWRDIGSSYLPSEMNVAFLWAQLEIAQEITDQRLAIWSAYNRSFMDLHQKRLVELPYIPNDCVHNGHMFYLKLKDIEQRTDFISYMQQKQINCVFHYIPLHSAPAGQKYGRFHGLDEFTTKESERLVRLPLYYGMSDHDVDYVIQNVRNYFLS